MSTVNYSLYSFKLYAASSARVACTVQLILLVANHSLDRNAMYMDGELI